MVERASTRPTRAGEELRGPWEEPWEEEGLWAFQLQKGCSENPGGHRLASSEDRGETSGGED